METVSVSEAKRYAFLLLKFRLRSEKEIEQRLKKKGFEAKIAKQVVSFLKDKDFINDEIFVNAWIKYRLKKPYGLRKIKQELTQNGLDKHLIDNCISEIKGKDYSEEDIVKEIVIERLTKLKGIEPIKAKRRLYAYLLRRGFSPEATMHGLTLIDTNEALSRHRRDGFLK
ncbi:MAG: regulatory protein RecX [Candidatus Omnitrophota bacterium]|nr:regulatory protein RecX [Candidatus Omnitrophota bacterium]